MELNNEQLGRLAGGERLKFKAIRGKSVGGPLILDMLAGAIVTLCAANPDRVTVSWTQTQLMQNKFDKMFKKKISRNMVSARFQKLHDIGFLNRRQEPVIREGREEGYRWIYFIGKEGDVKFSEEEKASVVEGKMTKMFWTRVFRSGWSFFQPQNRFEEAIYDIISDISGLSFPISMTDYRKHCVAEFRDELSREDRVAQFVRWIIANYEIDQAIGNNVELIVIHATKYTNKIWSFIEKQIEAQQKMATSGLPFNQKEYDRVTGINPDSRKTVRQMKLEQKLAIKKYKEENP